VPVIEGTGRAEGQQFQQRGLILREQPAKEVLAGQALSPTCLDLVQHGPCLRVRVLSRMARQRRVAVQVRANLEWPADPAVAKLTKDRLDQPLHNQGEGHTGVISQQCKLTTLRVTAT
jgi:hypothetical protein